MAAKAWEGDSDFDVSSEDTHDTPTTKKSSPETTTTKLKPPSTPAPAPSARNDVDTADVSPPHANDPSHLSLSLFDHYNQSQMYSQIRKRRSLRKKPNRNENAQPQPQQPQEQQQLQLQQSQQQVKKNPTINDLKQRRILYEMNNYDTKWLWIDTLPTDDVNEYVWITQCANINHFPQAPRDNNNDDDTATTAAVLHYSDMDAILANHTASLERQSLNDFDYQLNEARKSVINSPLFPQLGCLGYCKEFYVTMCDWNADGVLAIKYKSDEATQMEQESKSLSTCRGYWQRMRYQMDASRNGDYLALLFDRHCVVRRRADAFSSDVCRCVLPTSFWEFTRFRCLRWSRHAELLAVASFHNDVVVYAVNADDDDNTSASVEEVVAFNEACDGKISGMVWRRCPPSFTPAPRNNTGAATATATATSASASYWLELIVLYDNGVLVRKAFNIDAATQQVIELESQVRRSALQYPHRSVTKWMYDGLDYFDGEFGGGDASSSSSSSSFLAVSCVAQKLASTTPRQTRLGHALMLCRLDADGRSVAVTAHYNSSIPGNSWFRNDSVCFTMADRRAKLYGRQVEIAEDGRRVLCVDARGNVELFAYTQQTELRARQTALELMCKIGNTREMSYGSYRSDARIFTMRWWDAQSVVILFCDNTFCVTPVQVLTYYNQRELKWSVNWLGPQREQLYGLPIISRAIACPVQSPPESKEEKEEKEEKVVDADVEPQRMFFILETSEAYVRRKDDEHLSIIAQPLNDIDKQQNSIYGWRKYRNVSLSTFSSLTAWQLFRKYLAADAYDKAIQIANKFGLNSDPAYQSQFQFLCDQYNQQNGNGNGNENSGGGSGGTQQQQNAATEFVACLEHISDELWIVDTILHVAVCDFGVLDSLLTYALDLLQHSQTLNEQRPMAFSRLLRYRERVATLRCIAESTPEFDLRLVLAMGDECDAVEQTRECTHLCYVNYVLFRDANMVDVAHALAAHEVLPALSAVFTYHAHEMSARERLKILSWIPTTTHPSLYAEVLPSVPVKDETPTPWVTRRWYARQDDDDEDEEKEEKTKDTAASDGLSVDEIAQWYRQRVYEIESSTGNVEYSLILCNFAVREKGIASLHTLLDTLLLFHKVVYEYGAAGDALLSLREFEGLDAEARLLSVVSTSTFESIVRDIETRSQYFVSERDLSLVLLNICPKLAAAGHIELVAAILNAHEQFELRAVVKRYAESNVACNVFKRVDSTPKDASASAAKLIMSKNAGEDGTDDWDDFDDNFEDDFDDDKHADAAVADDDARVPDDEQTLRYRDAAYATMSEYELLTQYALLCALQCDTITQENASEVWRGLHRLLTAVNTIQKDNDNNLLSLNLMQTDETPQTQRLAQFTALIKGGQQLSMSYDIHRSLHFYFTLFEIGHIQHVHAQSEQATFATKIVSEGDRNTIVDAVQKWQTVLHVSSHQLQHYDALHALLSSSTPGNVSVELSDAERTAICDALHSLAVDMTTELFRGIQQKARKYERDEDWQQLNQDFLHFQHRLFSFIDTEKIQLLFFSVVFNSCCFAYAQKCMQREPLPISVASLVDLSLQTAGELMDASSIFDSDELADARKCLALIPEDSRCARYHQLSDLLSAINILRTEFQYDDAPLVLRKLFDDAHADAAGTNIFNEHQLTFFRAVLHSENANFWKQDLVLQVIDELSLANQQATNEQKIQILCVLADHALQQAETHMRGQNRISSNMAEKCHAYAYELYLQIFSKKYVKTSKTYPRGITDMLWCVCCKLMESTTHVNRSGSGRTSTRGGGGGGGSTESQRKLQLLSHSLSTSEAHQMSQLLRLWQSVHCSDTYFSLIHSMALSLRKRKGEYVSDSDDDDNGNDGEKGIASQTISTANDWSDVVQDFRQRKPAYESMSEQQVRREVDMNEMEQMVDAYFDTDPDLLVHHKNDEIYAVLSTTNAYWKQLDTLSHALVPCCSSSSSGGGGGDAGYLHPSDANLELLIVSVVENIFLCDVSELITFLLLVQDVDVMHKSFLGVLRSANVPKWKRMELIEIAIKYFAYHVVNHLASNEEIECDDTALRVLPDNVCNVFYMNITPDEDGSGETQQQQTTIKDIVECKALSDITHEGFKNCFKKAKSYLAKWCKFNDK